MDEAPLSVQKGVKGVKTLADVNIEVLDEEEADEKGSQEPRTCALFTCLPATSPLITYCVELTLCAKHCGGDGVAAKQENLQGARCNGCIFHCLHAVVSIGEPTLKWLRKRLSGKCKGITKLMKRIRKVMPIKKKKKKKPKKKKKRKPKVTTTKKKKRRKLNCSMILSICEESDEDDDDFTVATKDNMSAEDDMSVEEETDEETDEDGTRLRSWWQDHDWKAYKVPCIVDLVDGVSMSEQMLFFLQGVCRLDRLQMESHNMRLDVALSIRDTPATMIELLPAKCGENTTICWSPPGWPFVRGDRKQQLKLGKWRWSAAGPIAVKRCAQTADLLANGTLYGDTESGVAFWSQWLPQFERVRTGWRELHLTAYSGLTSEIKALHSTFEDFMETMDSVIVMQNQTNIAVYCQSFERAHHVYNTGRAMGVRVTYVVTLVGIMVASGTKNAPAECVLLDHVEDWTLAQGFHVIRHVEDQQNRRPLTISALCDPALEQRAHAWLDWDSDASPRLFWAAIGGFGIAQKPRPRPPYILTMLDELRGMLVPDTPLKLRPLLQSPWCVGKGFRFYRLPQSGMKAPLWQQFRKKAKRMDLRSVLFVCGSSQSCKMVAKATRVPAHFTDKSAPGNLVLDTSTGLVSVLGNVEGCRGNLVLHLSTEKMYSIKQRDARLQMNTVVTDSRLVGIQFSFEYVLVVIVLSTSPSTKTRPEFNATRFKRVLTRCTAVNSDNVVVVSTRKSLEDIFGIRTVNNFISS